MAVQDYRSDYEEAGREWNVDPILLMAQGHQESGGNPNARGALDEDGIAQFRPATAAAVGLVDRKNARHSIWAQAKLMSQLLDKYEKPELALAAYNAGEGAVDAHLKGGRLPASTAQTYIPSIARHYTRLAADDRKGKPITDAKPAAAPAEEPDDAFLKRTTGDDDKAFLDRTAPQATEDDDAFLKRTGAAAVAPKPAPKPTYANPDNPAGEGVIAPEEGSGQPVGGSVAGAPPPQATGSMPPAIAHIGEAIASPFTEGGPIGPDMTTPFYQGPVGQVNRLVVGMPLSLLDAGARGFQGVFRGLGAAGNALVQGLGSDQGMGARLERDIGQLPDALAGMAIMPSNNVPRVVRNQLALDAAAEASPGTGLVMDRMTGGNFSGPSTNALVRAQAERVAAAQAAREDQRTAAKPGPYGGGNLSAAAASPEEAAVSRREMIAQRATAEAQKLYEAQPVGRDTTDYIPGVNPTEAQMVQTARAARNEKLLESEMPDGFRERRAENNDARVSYFQDMAGTPTLLRRAEEARTLQAEADLRAAWANKTAADTSPVRERAAAILESEDGRRPAVRAAVNSVIDQMTAADGKPITDPQLLYGVRKHIDDMLSREAARDTPLAQRAKAQLLELKKALDGVIEPAAPGFRQYLTNFAEASRPIDEMETLQGYLSGKSLLDSRNQMTYSGVQRMMRDIVADRMGNDINPAHSITDETMAKLWALRDDLRRVATADDLAKARGSDTFQNFMDFVKEGASKGALGAAHAVLAPTTAGLGNMALNALVSSSRAKTLRKGVDRALNPDRVNDLAPPRRDH